jgi:lysophospholipase L1-like esterase
MNPIKITAFILSVALLLLISLFAMPKEGVEIGDIKLTMPSFNEILGNDTITYADISDIVSEAQNIDSLPDVFQSADLNSTNDTIRANADSLIASLIDIEFYGDSKSKLINFFKKLESANKSRVRVLHYGDSQIEGDRITSFIRNKFQKMFGGSGPGLMPAIQAYGGFFSIQQTSSDNWKRFTAFGKIDTNVRHWKYGPLAAFSRFHKLQSDSLETINKLDSAFIQFNESKYSYHSVRNFQEVEIFYGNTSLNVNLTLLINDSLVKYDSLKANQDFASFKYRFARPIKDLTIKFEGKDSPDIYGISLNSVNGVIIDNIPLRGSSGTFFRKLDFAHMQKAYQKLNPDLVILQFGGNVMPYLKDVEACERYGNWFKSQILFLKKMLPNTAFILIGPSDMSIKTGNKYITYELLPENIKALKKAAEESGIAFWDMYKAMGGHNSMPSWVNAKPPLASTDFVHFTPQGSKVIANMFYNSLIYEYKKYKNLDD